MAIKIINGIKMFKNYKTKVLLILKKFKFINFARVIKHA